MTTSTIISKLAWKLLDTLDARLGLRFSLVLLQLVSRGQSSMISCRLIGRTRNNGGTLLVVTRAPAPARR